jgi:hypothetical protein
VIARYDSGNTADEIRKGSFSTLGEALAWVGDQIPTIKQEIEAIKQQTEDVRKIVQFIGGCPCGNDKKVEDKELCSHWKP